MINRHWTFRDFVSHGGRNVIQEWTREMPKRAKANFDVLLSILANVKIWTEGDGVKALRGGPAKGKGIIEIKCPFGGVQYRCLAFYGPDRGCCTLLVGCTHKQQRYNPTNAIETAIERKRLVESGLGGTCEHKE